MGGRTGGGQAPLDFQKGSGKQEAGLCPLAAVI